MEQLKPRPRRPKKFRFQYVHAWLTANYEPCKVADVGGGKGLLSYLLNLDGWDATVIDPIFQELPWKYRGLDRKRVKIKDRNITPRITSNFQPEYVKEYDLIVGLHLHGANMHIIEACAEYKKDFMLLPCCVIDEPVVKQYGINWRESLIKYASSLGHSVKQVKFSFAGRNIAIYTDKHLHPKKNESDLSQILIPYDSAASNSRITSP